MGISPVKPSKMWSWDRDTYLSSSSAQHQSCVAWCNQQKVRQELISMRQPMTKKWPPCCCFYISFHHQEYRSLQKSVHAMQVIGLLSFTSLAQHLCNQQGRQPYLLAVGHQKSKTDSFYVTMEKNLIPCQANCALGAFDELFKVHFVFIVSHDAALVNFYTFLQIAVYNIDVGNMKE